MRKASLGTLFFTVFMDLLGFGLVIPFLPGVARHMGASDLMATLLGASFSLMQFVFVPLWGRLSDQVGRRPILLASIAASSIGMAMLGLAPSLVWLFVARTFSGIATANIAVAQAYISDVTTPETRARGMGLIGMAFGLGFILGPSLGGLLAHYPIAGHVGALPAFVAAGLSALNFVFALINLPESSPPERRVRSRRTAAPFDPQALVQATAIAGVGRAVLIAFVSVLFFAGMEQTFRLFTEDAFGMSDAATATVFVVVGIVGSAVQGGLIGPLTKRFGETALLRAGLVIESAGFFSLAVSPAGGKAFLYGAGALIALGSGLVTPSTSSYVSRRAGPAMVGLTLGVLQSAAALARSLGPASGGVLYQAFGHIAPYIASGFGVLVAAALTLRLPPIDGSAALAGTASQPTAANAEGS